VHDEKPALAALDFPGLNDTNRSLESSIEAATITMAKW
jgi:hypothetical protein